VPDARASATSSRCVSGGAAAGAVKHSLRHWQGAEPPRGGTQEQARLEGRDQGPELLSLAIAQRARAPTRLRKEGQQSATLGAIEQGEVRPGHRADLGGQKRAHDRRAAPESPEGRNSK
jgi:hypothetical protein